MYNIRGELGRVQSSEGEGYHDNENRSAGSAWIASARNGRAGPEVEVDKERGIAVRVLNERVGDEPFVV